MYVHPGKKESAISFTYLTRTDDSCSAETIALIAEQEPETTEYSQEAMHDANTIHLLRQLL